jgi:hypothetical protein
MELTASTATINREIQKQGLMAMMGTLTQYYQQILQIAGVAMNPQTPPPVQKLALEMADGARYLMQMIVQTYEIRAVDTLLPQGIDEILQEQQAQQQAAPQGGPPQIPGAGPAQPSGPPISGPSGPAGPAMGIGGP